MLIKYFYQVGHQFQFDQKNGMVIPDIKQIHLTRHEIISLLEQDKVDVAKMESLKYWNRIHEGWVEISEKTIISMKDNELVLLLKMGEDMRTSNSDLQLKFGNLIKSISYQEQRIKDLENRLKNINMNANFQNAICEQNLDLQRNQSSSHNVAQFFGEDSRLDISFLYSNPLVKDFKDKHVPLNEPIDFESEINCLVDILQDSGKKITARFEVANLDNISEIIRKKPRILHISCHGAYEEIDGENKFFLHFEDNRGKLDKFDLEKLNNLLKSSQDDKSQIEIAFVSACHSEAVANVFREAKVPAVICVHSATKVLDEAAQKFAKIFYNALLDGKSIAYSFEQAKRVVSAGIDKNSKIPHCCCSHTHKSDCRWHEKSIKDYEEAHQYHLKQCNCNYKESHMHKGTCPWALNLISKENFESLPVSCNFIKICCCSPEAAHDESNKFLLKAEGDYVNESPFSGLPQGLLEVKNKNCCLNINFSVEMKTSLIGRNMELYNVVSVFSNQNLNKNRLVTVTGSEGVGKNSFSKLAGKYMFERKFFQDGVIYINTRGHNISDMWFISKIISTLELDNPIDDIYQFCNLIRHLRILIIINFSRQHEETLKDITKMMKTILDQTRNPKFLITLEKPLGLELYESKILLEPLDEYYSAKLLMTLAGDHLPNYLRNDIIDLAKHDIIKLSQGIPGKIHQIAGLLQEHKKLEVLIDKMKKDNMKKQNLSDELVKVLLDNMSKNSTLIYEILYLLSILPHGILEIEITSIYKNNYKEVIEILEYISQNTIIISKTFNKDLKQTVYALADDLIQSVNGLSIEDSVKLKCYRELVIFFGGLMRLIVNNIYVDNESAIEFSAAQNQGMWLTLSTNNPIIYQPEKIFQPLKRFIFDESNILSIIKIENKFLKEMMNKNDYEFIENIEQLSICMPTILKINKKMTECITSYNYFLKICEEHNLYLAQGRLFLFKASLYSLYFSQPNNQFNRNNNNIYYDTNNGGLIFSNLIHAKNLFESKNFDEGNAEASFVKAVIMYDIEINKHRFSHEKISKEGFENIAKELETGIKNYRKINNNQGLARASFIIAEYSVNNKHFEESVLNHYKEAIHIFEKDNKKHLQIKCLQGISKWYMGIKNYVMSKDFAEQAKLLAEKIKSNNKHGNGNELILYEINKQINEILDQSRFQSHNVFVFIKAHQLVKMYLNSDLIFQRSKSIERGLSTTNKNIEYTIDPLVNHYSTFRDRLNERFNKSKKELIIKFDFLTESNLKDILSKVGRVLHISSDDYNDQGSLFVEGPDGESLELLPEQIKELLSHSRCVYDLVIIAIPQGENLANMFVEAGIPHVICFKFVEEFIKQSESLTIISFYNIVHEFTITMLNCIILEQTVDDAYKTALREFNSQIAVLRKHLYEFNFRKENVLDKEDLLATVLLLPFNKDHQVKLYGKFHDSSNEETVLFEGKILDLSKVRARMHNVKKRNQALIGRKKEIYHAVKIVKHSEFFNLYGEPGIGKTLLAKEVCYFLYMRNYFREGIFYFDIAEVRNVEKIKALFYEADVYAAIDEMKKVRLDIKDYEDRKVLIVFDNADKILKYNDNQFFLFLKSFNKDNRNFHFCIVSNKRIENENARECMELPSLSPQESYLLFSYYVKRNIEKNEVDVDTIDLTEGYNNLMERLNNGIDLISISLRVKSCRGMPKYLKKLADLAMNKPLKRIEWKDLNLPMKMIRKSSLDKSSITSKETIKVSKSFAQSNVLLDNSYCVVPGSKGDWINMAQSKSNKNINLHYSQTNINDDLIRNNQTTNINIDNFNEENLSEINSLNKITNLSSSVNFQTGPCINDSKYINNLRNSNNFAAPTGNPLPNRNSFNTSNISTNSILLSNNNYNSNSNKTNTNYFNTNHNSLNSSLLEDNNSSNGLRKSITTNTSQTQIPITLNKNKIKRKKKQSEILEVEEEGEREIIHNDEEDVMSFIMRPSDNLNNSFSDDEEKDNNQDEVDTFINNQVFTQNNVNNNVSVSSNNPENINYFDLSSINHENNIFKNQNNYVNNLNNLNIDSIQNSRRDSIRNSGQPIIIQNFFNGSSKNYEDSNTSRDTMNRNNVNMNINIHHNPIDKSPFSKVNTEDFQTRARNVSVGNFYEFDISSSGESAELSEEEFFQRSLINTRSFDKTSNENTFTTNPNKKKKKGMKSGKMHNKYGKKSNNKYVPNNKKNKKDEE